MDFRFKNQGSDGAPNPWRTRSVSTPYENKWIRVSHRDVLNPSGGEGIYGVVQFKNVAVGIVPLDAVGNTWLVGQYRYTLERYSWEIPEGGCPMDEDPLAAAQRELLEETGIVASRWSPLLELHTSNSVTDEYGVAYVAQGLSFGRAEPEETEDLRLWKLPFAEALDMALRGDITDALSLAAIFKTNEWLRARLLRLG